MISLAYGYCDMDFGIVLLDRGDGTGSKYTFGSKEEMHTAMEQGGWLKTASKPLIIGLIVVIAIFVLLHVLESLSINDINTAWLNRVYVNNIVAVIIIIVSLIIGITIASIAIHISLNHHRQLVDMLDNSNSNRYDFKIDRDLKNIVTIKKHRSNQWFTWIGLFLALAFVVFLLAVILFYTTEYSVGGMIVFSLFSNILVVSFMMVLYYTRYKMRNYHLQTPTMWK
ncbi:hypothetical protein [Culicoidibacter larvae]|uniref:Uncharacterized protein n=1 Tax=Culicoidibacter larvae TaxID=2579976 RepID=A0A5R8Q818_9FIRM|nr:hypothetical protein [Culicoidibacter larvae]TLG71537.1 hypothetical protein FEZ08_10615 [Culicoidibacter larvae]